MAMRQERARAGPRDWNRLPKKVPRGRRERASTAHLGPHSPPHAPAPPGARRGDVQRGSWRGARTGWGTCARRCRTPRPPPPGSGRYRARCCQGAAVRAARGTAAPGRTAGGARRRKPRPRPRRRRGSSRSGQALAPSPRSRRAAGGSALARRPRGRAARAGRSWPRPRPQVRGAAAATAVGAV